MRQRATVKFFNVDRGFGFLVPADGSGDVFFSISSQWCKTPSCHRAIRFCSSLVLPQDRRRQDQDLCGLFCPDSVR
jgi:hypothetical protein